MPLPETLKALAHSRDSKPARSSQNFKTMSGEQDNERDTNREKDDFLYPIGHYGGNFTPQELAFNANLQEFAQRVSYICGLESNGKLSPDAAYEEIRALVDELKRSKQELLDDSESSDP